MVAKMGSQHVALHSTVIDGRGAGSMELGAEVTHHSLEVLDFG